MESVVCVEKENVLICAGDCALTLLPHCGGKVASIRLKGKELLQAPLAPYGPATAPCPLTKAMPAAGTSACPPSQPAPSTPSTVPIAVPDHGDVWRVEWKVLASNSSSVTMSAECFSLPLQLVRTIALTQTEKGYRIAAEYKVTNTGTAETPWSWSAHPGYAAEEGDILQLPDSVRALRIEWTRNGRLDKSRGIAAWPLARLTAGGETDLRISTPTHSGVGDKLFAGPLAASENWVALERPKAGVRLRVSFDSAATPYLGLWICQDGYPEGGGLQQHCVAMEPTTAPVDSLGIEGPWSRTLAAGESFRWPMTLDLELL